MNFLKRGDTAHKYNISGTTLDNWLDRATRKENNLEVVILNNKIKLIDSYNNQLELQRLSTEAKIFKNKISKKVHQISKEFYEIFSTEEIIDIFNDLKFKNKINIKYTYKNVGSLSWDNFYNNHESQIESSVSDIMNTLSEDILYYIKDSSKINLVDIGPGNGWPAKKLIEKLKIESKISEYFLVDISPQNIDIATKNIKSAFPKLKIGNLVADVEQKRLGSVFLESKVRSESNSNLVLFTGNSISDMGDRLSVLKNIRSGISDDDIFICTFTRDCIASRSDSIFFSSPAANTQYIWMLDLLGFDTENLIFNSLFNNQINSKTKKIKLDKDYNLNFNIFGINREIELHAKDEINIWTHYLTDIESFIKDIDSADLQLLELKLDKTLYTGLVICKVKC